MIASRNIREYEEVLEPTIFFRPHQSYLVNKNYVQSINREGLLTLRGKEETIPISSRKKEFVIGFLSR